MKKAFTMIELIFVIVIIGILAAVAIPKLGATRDDAKVAAIITDGRKILGDLAAFYTSQRSAIWKSGNLVDATNVRLFTDSSCATAATETTAISEDIFYLCDGAVECVSFRTIDEGNLTITATAGTTSEVCKGVAADSAMISIAGATGVSKVHKFGGVNIER